MRSPKSVRRPHIRQQLTNRRKNLGRVAKSQQNQFRQWLLTAVLPNSINDKRKEVFASLELTEQPQKVEKAKKSDKKKAQKQIAKDHEAEKQVAAKKAAEKEAKRAQADAKKRAAEEEEHKKWKAQQEKVQKEQEKKEAELKKLQNEKKKEKAQKAKESKAAPAPAPAPVAPVEEEVIVKKVAKVDQAAPTKTVEQAQDAAAPAGKKNKNKKKSESESASAPVEQVAEKKEVANEEPKQQVAPQEKKKNKKDKKKSESETAAPVEQVEQIVENSAPAANEIEKKNKKDKKKSESEPAPAEVTPVVSQKPTADNMDFLDFVTAKPDQPEAVVEKVAAAEAAPLEAAPTASDKKKNKKDKKKSESEPATVEASPVVSQKPTADSMDFLDFVTAKPDKPEDVVEQVATSEAAPLEAAPAASDHKKKNKKDKKKSENEPAPVEATPVVSQKPTADSMDFLDFVTAKPDQPDDVVEQVATAEASQIETSPVAIEGKKKNKKDKNKSESEKVSEPAPVPEAAASVSQKPTADSMDFLDFVTAKPDAVEEQSQNEPATVQEEASVPEQAEKKKNEKKSKKASESEPRPTADDSMDFLDFVSKKPEQEETVQEVKQVEQPKEKTAKKNKKNKKNSESEKKSEETPVEAAKPEEKSVEEHIEAPKTVEPIQAENETVASAGKKNKKNKNRKNSEKEAKEPTPAPEVVEEVFEKKIVSPNTTENGPAPAAAPVAAPAQKENKNKKKNKKESGNSESHDVAPTVEIPQTTDAGKQSPGSDKENSSVPNGSAKKQLSVEELDYGVTAQNNEAAAGGDKKNKKKNKKGKNSNSISENTQVIAQLDQDHLDQLADDEVQAITGAAGTHSPPIQVHEVTSSEQHANGNGTTIEKQTTIEITQALDDTNISPTQFQKNVQKLVQAQLAKHDIVEIDPTVKLRIDAQLIKLSEKKAPAVVVEHVNYIKPLPMELHVSRPSTPSRDRVYKLLPKDILFCAGLIDSHGENYAAMAADARNLFKDTSRALQRKIRIFKESPHYQTYLRAKEENRPLEEVIAAEAH